MLHKGFAWVFFVGRDGGWYLMTNIVKNSFRGEALMQFATVVEYFRISSGFHGAYLSDSH